jgi:hypothetical protein
MHVLLRTSSDSKLAENQWNAPLPTHIIKSWIDLTVINSTRARLRSCSLIVDSEQAFHPSRAIFTGVLKYVGLAFNTRAQHVSSA